MTLVKEYKWTQAREEGIAHVLGFFKRVSRRLSRRVLYLYSLLFEPSTVDSWKSESSTVQACFAMHKSDGESRPRCTASCNGRF